MKTDVPLSQWKFPLLFSLRISDVQAWARSPEEPKPTLDGMGFDCVRSGDLTFLCSME